MNKADTEIITSILLKQGWSLSEKEEESDAILLNTCAIRENAEQKIWQRLYGIRGQKRKEKRKVTVGVLGCMAERLKTNLFKEDLCDVIAGPDAYRDLPNLLETPQSVNVLLSMEETYADIKPVRKDTNNINAYISIMRGCNNMCSFCIVPFTRGRERSRPFSSIMEEVDDLVKDGFKEITLLGQNVNSYNDTSEVETSEKVELSNQGFKTIYKLNPSGITFKVLLDEISKKYPDLRIRFTSPHPKDFPDGLIQLIYDRPNISKLIHLPAQSGSTTCLERMRRGYTREAYLELIHSFRSKIPDVMFSTDIIVGFCGETEKEYQDTISLMDYVKYDQAFMYAYSLREKTHAHRNYQDDVPADIKNKRVNEIINLHKLRFRETIQKELGKKHLVLIQEEKENTFFGKNDHGKSVTIPKIEGISLGDFVAIKVKDIQKATLIGEVIGKTTISKFY